MHKSICLLSGILIFQLLSAQTAKTGNYHKPAELVNFLQTISAGNKNYTLHNLGTTPGKNELLLTEYLRDPSYKGSSVLVIANMEGTVPLATEAALHLCNLLPSMPDSIAIGHWYVLPCGNPDALSRFFTKPLYQYAANGRPVNSDKDDQTDEDGFDDLNNDGFITQMRVPDPEGEYIVSPDNPRLMRLADPLKGERGTYKLYTEGVDNDLDGSYNEDGPGGVNPGINFPHLFNADVPEAGRWPGSEMESLELMKFVFAHPDIAMVITLGADNFCYAVPRSGRRGSTDMNQISIPERWARRLSADPSRTYTMNEVIGMVKSIVPPGTEVDESMVAGMLDLGQVVNPLAADLKWYTSLSEKYKAFLKQIKMDDKRVDPEKDKDGSPELWAYYQLGLPSFALDFWSLPISEKKEGKGKGLSADSLASLTPDQFLALDNSSLDAFLKANGVSSFTSSGVKEMVKSGKTSPKQVTERITKAKSGMKNGDGDTKETAWLNYNDEVLNGAGFVNWQKVKHSQFGEVEVGGFVPFTDNTPPAGLIDSIVDPQLPWIFKLAQQLPDLHISASQVKNLGAGLYQVDVFVENRGFLPFPTAMGKRNQQVAPAVLVMDPLHAKLLSGKKRTVISGIGGNDVSKFSWIIQDEKPEKLSLQIESPQFRASSYSVELK